MKKTITKTNTKIKSNGIASVNGTADRALSVQKTYKLYIGGKFSRTESGRYYTLHDKKNNLLANVCRGSRKDFRNAVVAARKAHGGWAGRSAYNRGQILYRIAEMLQWRSDQFVAELKLLGSTTAQAKKELNTAVDRIVHYAGWSDKYQQIFSAVNPVASSHFNFSVLEPMGVISAFAPEDHGLLGLVSVIMPVIVGGNSIIILASKQKATPAISFAEVLHTADLPGGVVNILTGFRDELVSHFSSHMDVNAVVYCGHDTDHISTIQTNVIQNLKRPIVYRDIPWRHKDGQGPYFIKDTMEVKTTWHPIEQTGQSGTAY